jgi:hypothetical protein
MKSEEDVKTFEFVKKMRREFKTTRFQFNDLSKNTNIFGRPLLRDERIILYKA